MQQITSWACTCSLKISVVQGQKELKAATPLPEITSQLGSP